MTFLVPYDGTYLAEAALTRASEYAEALDEDLTVVTVIPDEEAYATHKGWYDEMDDGTFSVQYIAGKLHTEITEIAPRAAFRYEVVNISTASTISNQIQEVAEEIIPSVVFIGTDNVGEIAEPLASVAGGVAEDTEYDVHIVRYFSPTTIQEISAEKERYPTA